MLRIVNLIIKATTLAMGASFFGALWFGVHGQFHLAGLCLKVAGGSFLVNLVTRTAAGSPMAAIPPSEADADVAILKGDLLNEPHTNPIGRFDVGVVKPVDDDLFSK